MAAIRTKVGDAVEVYKYRHTYQGTVTRVTRTRYEVRFMTASGKVKHLWCSKSYPERMGMTAEEAAAWSADVDAFWAAKRARDRFWSERYEVAVAQGRDRDQALAEAYAALEAATAAGEVPGLRREAR